MRSIIDLNDGWMFEGRTEVRLPHSAVDGAIKLVGPDVVPMRGGAAGFWVTATDAGAARVSVSHSRIGEASIELVSMRGDQ